jgi:FAD/FMN-containing dehydrogenase
MLESAEKVVDEIMILAQQLGGVISGEHGIGLTKYQYLSDKHALSTLSSSDRV